jgi:hypothetical protein
MKKALLGVLLVCACDRFVHRAAPDAGVTVVDTTPIPTTTTTTTTTIDTPPPDAGWLGLHIDDEEEAPVPEAGGPCPIPIHPGYCRRRCRSFIERQSSMHARRVASPTRAGTGKCGAFTVFAEDGAGGGIVEYYDDKRELVGAEDSRQKPCGTYGTIPKCKLEITWGPPRPLGGGGLSGIK